LNLNLRKKLVKCYIWIKAFCGAATSTVPRVYQNCLERFEMWCCSRIEVSSCNDGLKTEEALQRIAENKNILHTIKQKKPNWSKQQFTTLKQQNAQNFPYIFMLQYHTEYWYMFRSTRDHCQGINSKEYRLTPLLCAADLA